jgi:hypothetical protein
MHHVATPRSIGHRALLMPAPVSAGQHAHLKSGGGLPYRPNLRSGCSAPRAIPILSAIAASKALVWFQLVRRYPLKTLPSARPYRRQVSAKAPLKPVLPAKACSLPERHPLPYRRQVSAKAPLKPVLPAKACSLLPKRHPLPLVATGESTRPEHRVFVDRPAARAVREYALLPPLPLQAKSALRQAGLPPGAKRAKRENRTSRTKKDPHGSWFSFVLNFF